MKKFRLLCFGFVLVLQTSFASAQGTGEQLKTYLSERDQIKAMDLEALKTLATSSGEKNARRGLAEYYVFLKSPTPNGDAAAGAKSVSALEKAADTYLDPCTYVKLAVMYSQDYPEYGVKRDLTKCLRYLSVAWEMADLSDKATGDNALLTLVVNNTLGLGDGIFGDKDNQAILKETLDSIRPDVLKARGRFKKLYALSVKDEFPGSTNLERHYAQ